MGQDILCMVVGLGLCMAQVDCSKGTCMDGRARPFGSGLEPESTDNEGRMVVGRGGEDDVDDALSAMERTSAERSEARCCSTARLC